MAPLFVCARAVIPENVRKRLNERNLSKDTLHRIPPPKRHRPSNKLSTSPVTEFQTAVRLPKRTIEIPAVRHITGKNADEPLWNRFQKPVSLMTFYPTASYIVKGFCALSWFAWSCIKLRDTFCKQYFQKTESSQVNKNLAKASTDVRGTDGSYHARSRQACRCVRSDRFSRPQ